MKRLLVLLFIALSSTLFAQTYGIATTKANLRENAVDGAVITTLPPGAKVTIIETQDGWSQVTYGSYTGYVKSSLLRSANQEANVVASPDNASIKHYTNSDGQRVQSPTKSSTVPSGATAQCRDGSYSFSQHRQGTCSHHGGVAQWL